jgi:hypothetical protein
MNNSPFNSEDLPKISAVLPIYKDANGRWHELFFKKMIPSLKVISGLDIEFLLGFQKFNQSEVEGLIRMMELHFGEGFRYQCFLRNYPEPVSMCQILEDIANLNPNTDIYMIMDDDFIFRGNAKQRYEQIIDYMRDNPKCGSFMAGSSLGGRKSNKSKIVCPEHNWWWTNRGLFLRNLKHLSWRIVPEDSHDLRGGLEESYAVFSRMAEGYFAAKTFYVDTHHSATRMDEKFEETAKRKGRYPLETDMHRFKEVQELIRSKWNDPTWTFEKRRTPKGLINPY